LSILSTKLAADMIQKNFPEVEGKALNGQTFRIPDSLKKQYNLIIIAYKREQQQLVDTWLPKMEPIEQSKNNFAFYEFPTISKLNFFSRWFIYNGMRSGIKAESARARTVTLHLDKEEFNQHLGILNEEDIYLFLLDKSGTIIWQSKGVWSKDKEEDLINYLE
jgi:hypothetical protein